MLCKVLHGVLGVGAGSEGAAGVASVRSSHGRPVPAMAHASQLQLTHHRAQPSPSA